MAIETLQARPEKMRAIEVTCRGVLIQGQPCKRGFQAKVPEAEAHDLVHAKQAKFLTPTEVKK